jgi:hypothetical protein
MYSSTGLDAGVFYYTIACAQAGGTVYTNINGRTGLTIKKHVLILLCMLLSVSIVYYYRYYLCIHGVTRLTLWGGIAGLTIKEHVLGPLAGGLERAREGDGRYSPYLLY